MRSYEDVLPPKYRAAYRKSIDPSAPKSRNRAIKSFCLVCVGGDPKEARHCTDKACPLWQVRPYQRAGKPSKQGGNARE